MYKMLSMSGDGWVFSVALCLMFVPSNGVQHCEDSCLTQTLTAPLGSSVLLRCNFANAKHSSRSTFNWVSWLQMPAAGLVKLTSKGHIWYQDPRHGRVKAFPNQGSKGNYSICIDELQQSDLGCYRCEQAGDCVQVEVVTKKGEMSEEIMLLVYICVGVATFIILMGACSYCCVKCTSLSHKSTQDTSNNPDNAVSLCHIADISPPPAVPQREAGAFVTTHNGVFPFPTGANDHDLVYENDGHDPAHHQDDLPRNQHDLPGGLQYLDRNEPTASGSRVDPNRNQGNFDRMKNRSQRRKQRFHTELLSRFRQASLSRHYYVNHAELHQQVTPSEVQNHQRARVGRKKAKRKCEYKNPIYNDSPDQL